MELLNSVTGMPYAFHFAIVTIVFVGAVLLFVFGFQSTEELAYGKVKADLKSIKKRKVKEKKSTNSVVNNNDSKSKGSTTPKSKVKNSDDKTKKTNALKESRNVKINVKNTKKEQANNEKNKNRGKENVNLLADTKNELGVFEKPSRKNGKAQNNILPSNKGGSGKRSNNLKNSKKEGKIKENTKKVSATRTEKKPKDDEGEWQEAKSSKKRRRVFREDL